MAHPVVNIEKKKYVVSLDAGFGSQITELKKPEALNSRLHASATELLFWANFSKLQHCFGAVMKSGYFAQTRLILLLNLFYSFAYRGVFNSWKYDGLLLVCVIRLAPLAQLPAKP